MAIGKRIKFFRTLKGLTQKQFGEALGFKGKTSDVRLAQYEAEARIPKEDLVKDMARILEVSPQALTIPEIDTYDGLLHTFFALEDMYGLKIKDVDGDPCLYLDKSNLSSTSISKMFYAWLQQSAKLENGEISKDEYDEWRYKYPELNTSRHLVKIEPSEELNDYLVKQLKKEMKKKK